MSVKHRIAILCLARTLSTGIETKGPGTNAARPDLREPYPRGLKPSLGHVLIAVHSSARTLSTGIETQLPKVLRSRPSSREPYPRGLKRKHAPLHGHHYRLARTLSTGIETLQERTPPLLRRSARTLSTGIETHFGGPGPFGQPRMREPYPRGLKHIGVWITRWSREKREPYPRGLKPARASPRGMRPLRANLIHGD